MTTHEILSRAYRGERIDVQEGLQLLTDAHLLELAELANHARFRKNPNRWITFVQDTNPNYSNVCTIDCVFCAFYRRPGEEGAYTLSVDEIIQKLKDAASKGITTALLQGGAHPDLPFQYYIDLVERTRAEVPSMFPHFFSTSEIIQMAAVSGHSTRQVLERLWQAGMRTLPGGGAEILSDKVRRRISSRKGTSEEWLRVMREAHSIGYKTTATMMYGHIERNDDILVHLESLRALQDETGGFTAFIPWSFKPGNTPLEKVIPMHATTNRYLQMIALSRIYLDNFDHIQASWFSEGKKTGQMALHFGADDFGGTLLEENVHAAANFVNTTNTDDCIKMIHQAGFAAAERTTLYEILRVVEPINKEVIPVC
jgi:dehypoxanthine futalosine cyclase